MAAHEQIAAAKKRETDNKQSRKNDKEQLQQLPFNEGLSTYPLTDTPFHPRMEDHADSLSKIQSPVQRSEFIKQLHRTYGNRYVQRLAESMKVQAKLSISQPGDIYEQEADRVAEEVTRSIIASVRRQAPEEEEELQTQEDDEEELLQGKLDVQRQSPEEDEELMQGKLNVQRQSPEEDEELMQGKLDVQRQSPEEDEELIQGKVYVNRQSPEEEEELQMKPDVQAESIVADDIETRINSKKGSGQPLSNEVKKPMEQAFGNDFSDVHTHTDSEADILNKELNAKAFTVGQDIFFREGEYSPGSDNGMKLIAHELTHVVQQANAGITYRKVHNLRTLLQPNPWKWWWNQSSFKNIKLAVQEYNAMNGNTLVELRVQLDKLDDIKRKIQIWRGKHDNPTGKNLLRKNELDIVEPEVDGETAAVGRQIRYIRIADAMRDLSQNRWDSATRLDDVLQVLEQNVIKNEKQLNTLESVFVQNQTKLFGEIGGTAGTGFYDPNTNELHIDHGAADVMADTIVFESGNALRGGEYRALDARGLRADQPLSSFGETKSGIEAGTTIDYLDYLINLVDVQGVNLGTLPERARRQYDYFQQNYPAYWNADQQQKRAIIDQYKIDMAATPQQPQAAPGSRMRLNSADLYSYEYTINKTPGVVLNKIRARAVDVAGIGNIIGAAFISRQAPMYLTNRNIDPLAMGVFYIAAVRRVEVYYHVDLHDIRFNQAQITVAQNEAQGLNWDPAQVFEDPKPHWQDDLSDNWQQYILTHPVPPA